MKRIVVFGQTGAFGQRTCGQVAGRLAQRLGLPVVPAADEELAAVASGGRPGWIAVGAVGSFSDLVLRAADTAIWLHYSPLAVAHAWFAATRNWLRGVAASGPAPLLADVRDSLLHMAWTPHVRRQFDQSALSHLQVFHLRSPSETDFWLHAQEHRLAGPAASAQPA